MNTKHMRGFTLYELLVTMLVAGVVFGLGVPNLLEFSRNNAMAGAANDFVSTLMAARTEAVKRQVPVTVCASPDPFAANPVCVPNGAGATGYFAWVDENNNPVGGVPTLTDASDGNAQFDANETVLVAREIPDTLAGIADTYFVAYGPNGARRNNVPTAAGALNSATMMLICDPRGNVAASGSLSAARLIQIERTGRARLLTEVPDIAAATALAGIGCP
jgi:type IV fimbrial biogenesis protein FimT